MGHVYGVSSKKKFFPFSYFKVITNEIVDEKNITIILLFWVKIHFFNNWNKSITINNVVLIIKIFRGYTYQLNQS